MKHMLGRLVCWVFATHRTAFGSAQFIDGTYTVRCARCGRRCAQDDDGEWYLV